MLASKVIPLHRPSLHSVYSWFRSCNWLRPWFSMALDECDHWYVVQIVEDYIDADTETMCLNGSSSHGSTSGR